jgi:two-component system nitrogen regulation response regulator GlnG
VRIVSATHRDLRQAVRQGTFREDLFYRLNVVPVRLPALRERLEDIPELVGHFIQRAESEGLPRRSISDDAMDALREHNWPGNVRELENLVRRLLVMTADEIISAEDVSEILSEQIQSPTRNNPIDVSITAGLDTLVDRYMEHYFQELGQNLPSEGLYERIIQQVEGPLINHMLSAVNGNQVKAAEILGINRNTLRKKIRTLGLPVIKGIVGGNP